MEEERFNKLLSKAVDVLKGYPSLNRLLGDSLPSTVKENYKRYRAARNVLFHMCLSARPGGISSGGADEIEQLESALSGLSPWDFSGRLVEGLKEGLLSPSEMNQASTISLLLGMAYFKKRGYSLNPHEQKPGYVFEASKGDLRFSVRTLALPVSPYMEEKTAGGEEPPTEVLEEIVPWLTQRVVELDNTPCPEGAAGVLFLQLFNNLSGNMGRDDEIIGKASRAYFSRGGKVRLGESASGVTRMIIYIHYLLEKAEVIYPPQAD